MYPNSNKSNKPVIQSPTTQLSTWLHNVAYIFFIKKNFKKQIHKPRIIQINFQPLLRNFNTQKKTITVVKYFLFQQQKKINWFFTKKHVTVWFGFPVKFSLPFDEEQRLDFVFPLGLVSFWRWTTVSSTSFIETSCTKKNVFCLTLFNTLLS